MRRLSLTEVALILLLLLLFPSCQTRGDSSLLSQAENLRGSEAAVLYKEYLDTEESEKVRWNYIYSLYQGEELDSALEEVEKAISLYPSNIRFLYLKALVLEKSGDKENEALVLEKSREMNPGEVAILERLLSIYKESDSVKAKEVALSILRFESKNYAAVEYLSSGSEYYSVLFSTIKKTEEKEEAPTEGQETTDTEETKESGE